MFMFNTRCGTFLDTVPSKKSITVATGGILWTLAGGSHLSQHAGKMKTTRQHTHTHRDRDRDRDRRQKTEDRRQRKREDKTEEERQDKRREDTRRQDKTRQEKREDSFSVWWCMAVFFFC